MKKPSVSVVMPAYNCEKHIAKAIDSVLDQTKTITLELIVINDCSTDQTEKVIEQYLTYPQVRYIKNEKNLGVAKTRNKGVSVATGEYIAFLDSDDWWAPEKLDKQLAMLHDTGYVLCSTARQLMNADGVLTNKIIDVPEEITYPLLLRHNCINCSSVVIKKEVAEEFPMGQDDSHEDYIMWLKVLKKYKYACAINEPLLKYRLSNKGKSGSKLKSARMTFKVYRYMGFSWWKSIRYFISYAWNGIKKYGL